MEAVHIINEKQKLSKKPVFETYPFSPENIDSGNLARLSEVYEVGNILHEKIKAVAENIIRITNAEKLF